MEPFVWGMQFAWRKGDNQGCGVGAIIDERLGSEPELEPDLAKGQSQSQN